MLGSCRLNNKSMRNVRRSEVYQAMAIDLAMLGVISKEECEMLLGSGIPEGIVLPNGEAGQIVSEKNLPEQPAFIQTEPEQTTEPDAEPEQTESEQTEPVQTTGPEPIPGVTVMPDTEPEGPETMGEVTEPTGQEPEVVSGVEGEIVNDESGVSPVDGDKLNDEGTTESNN